MITLEIWADVRCPWCWIGMRSVRRAAAVGGQPLRVAHRSFLLEPDGPPSPGRALAEVARSEWGMSGQQWQSMSRRIRTAGASAGLAINLDTALAFDSRPVHRLLKLASVTEWVDIDAAWDSAFAAHFERNENLGDLGVLKRLASTWGLDENEVAQALVSDRLAAEVVADMAEAARLGISSVPTFVTADGHRIAGSVDTGELVRLLVPAGAIR